MAAAHTRTDYFSLIFSTPSRGPAIDDPLCLGELQVGVQVTVVLPAVASAPVGLDRVAGFVTDGRAVHRGGLVSEWWFVVVP
jgi:hypothetical protein